MGSPVLLTAVMGVWLTGFALFRVLAAREVARSGDREILSVLAWTGWLKGTTSKAKLFRNLALAWLVIFALVFAWTATLLQS